MVLVELIHLLALMVLLLPERLASCQRNESKKVLYLQVVNDLKRRDLSVAPCTL